MKIVSITGVCFNDNIAYVVVLYDDYTQKTVSGETLIECMKQIIEESKK